MIPSNVYPTLFINNESKSVLFKLAIHFAKLGYNVWYISPVVLDDLPDDVPPEREVLQLITCVYLNDYKSLIKHLNAIHLWHKVPKVILVSGFEVYTKICDEKYDALLSAVITTTLLDSGAVCYKKSLKSTFIITSCKQIPEVYLKRLQVLNDLYFNNLIEYKENTVILDEIINYYSDK